ncbi:MAG TPA: amino acid adenylation domain-containing protein [Actinospica sp.]|jgi:amino acid adenylation domain-containing protein|nr:amino acid adenylation domain-containing protein [Actinospica sp.]
MPDGRTIHAAVSGHAARQPDATALFADGRPISFAVLDRASDGYAAELAESGVRAGQVVPTVLPRSALLAALQLAILKCGAAYTGIDPRWPADRVRMLVEQTGSPLVVGDPSRATAGLRTYRPETEDLAAAAERGGGFTGPAVDASEPATVFFTSGTTGRPKGVVAPHRAVTRMFTPGGLAGFGPGHATPQAAPLPWDMYAFELWGQTVAGGTSVLVDGDHLMPGMLRELIGGRGVDTLWLTTSLFNLFIDEDEDCFAGLDRVYTGGEKLSPHHVRRFVRRYPELPLHNGYGPAENCMLTTTWQLSEADCDLPGGVPVGRAVPGTEVVLLGPDGKPCAPGESGEICAAGDGLAVGYLGDPELTAEKFPTVEVAGTPVRVYRTGDVGVTDAAGVLHFRGRVDRQVKISGHRIELGEIEAAARALHGLRSCAAIAVPGPDGSAEGLALFYVPDGPAEADGGDPLLIRKQLADELPSYLVPAVVRSIGRLPVTGNGKLDHAALTELARRPRRRGRP